MDTLSTNYTIINNTFVESGWPLVTKDRNRYVYRRGNITNPYNEFIIDYTSPTTLAITVPIQCQGTTLAYQNTFLLKEQGLDTILNYLQMHLVNY